MHRCLCQSLMSLALAVGCGGVAAQAPPPAEPAQAQEFARSEPYIDRMRKQGDVFDLAYRDALARALVNNLQIRIENYNQALSTERIRQARAYYDPVLGFSVGVNSNKSPLSGAGLSLGAGLTSVSNFGPSVVQYLPGGGGLSFGLTNNRSFDKTSALLVNPAFNSSMAMSFTQPLLRGSFAQTAITRQLRILNLSATIAESQFRQTVSEVVQAVQNQYWELVYALESYETQRQSRELAVAHYEITRQKVILGLLTPVALTSARAEVAVRNQTTIQAEVQIVSSQNGLKRLLAPDPSDPLWNSTLVPVARPALQEFSGTLQDAIQAAVRNRPELRQLDLRMAQNTVDEEYLRKQTRPSVDFTASLSSVGYAGKVWDPNSGLPLWQHAAYGGYGTSWRQVFGFDFMSWGVGLEFQLPLRNRAALAELAQNRISQNQLQQQLKNTQQSVIVEVRNAFQLIEVQKKNVEAARLARQLSEEQLEGQTARFDAGFTTTFEVQRYQRDLADARVRELRALIDFQQAVIALQKATDQIIDANDIAIARGKPAVP